MTNPLVSIIIPTYSRPKNLCRAIDSVLKQTYSPIEVIVVDDNGIGTEFQKETAGVLSKYLKSDQITYIAHEKNKNGSAARNTGTKASHGEIIGYLDDDDIFKPEKVEVQVKRLMEAHRNNSRVAGVYCNIEMKNYKNKDFNLMSNKEGNLTEDLLTGDVRFNSSTILLYRYAYDAINGWDETFRRQQDWEFCIRFFRMYEMVQASCDKCLVIKYSTPNTILGHPERTAEYLNYFLYKMKADIDVLPRCREIYGKKKWIVMRNYIQAKMYRKALAEIHEVYKYKDFKISDVFDIMKSLIKSII